MLDLALVVVSFALVVTAGIVVVRRRRASASRGFTVGLYVALACLGFTIVWVIASALLEQ